MEGVGTREEGGGSLIVLSMELLRFKILCIYVL